MQAGTVLGKHLVLMSCHIYVAEGRRDFNSQVDEMILSSGITVLVLFFIIIIIIIETEV